MKAVVTGAGGLVGRVLVPKLEASGFDVHGCDLEVDVADPDAIGAFVAQVEPDAVVHLAAISATRLDDDAASSIFRINFGGAAAVLDAVRAHAPSARLLFVSSGLIYGRLAPGEESFDESAALRPRGAYEWTKAAGDRLMAEVHDLPVIRARPFNHTGWGRRDDFVESRFAKQLVAIEAGRLPREVSAFNVEGARDFLAVRDVCDAYVRLLDPSVPAGSYNIASGQGTTIREVFERLVAVSGIQAELITDPADQDADDRSVGNAGKLRGATGWEPVTPLDESLLEVIDFWREQEARAGSA